MKTITPIFYLLIIILTSCVKKNTPESILDEMPGGNPVSQYSGNFSDGPYGNVTGMAIIYQDGSNYQLKLMDLSSSNGPDLRVYLSKEMFPENYIDLGALKATGGNQVYDIPSGTDITQFKYALVHCRKYNHLFGWALLQ